MSDEWMLLCWSQHEGYFERPGPAQMAWLQNENKDERFRRLGYMALEGVGDCIDGVEIYYGDRIGLPAHIVTISNPFTSHQVAVWTYPDLLAIRERLFARFPALPDLQSVADKAFRAWHGHEAGAACWECDPRQMHKWKKQEEEDRRALSTLNEKGHK